MSFYTHSTHLNIPRSFKIVIYLILEHIYAVALTHSPGSLFHSFIVRCKNAYFLSANLHSSLANAQLSSCSVVCLIFNKHASDATIQTCCCVCYLKNLYLVTTDSSCLQSCSGLVTEARCWFGVRPVWRSPCLAFAPFGVRPVWRSPCLAFALFGVCPVSPTPPHCQLTGGEAYDCLWRNSKVIMSVSSHLRASVNSLHSHQLSGSATTACIMDPLAG